MTLILFAALILPAGGAPSGDVAISLPIDADSTTAPAGMWAPILLSCASIAALRAAPASLVHGPEMRDAARLSRVERLVDPPGRWAEPSGGYIETAIPAVRLMTEGEPL